MFAHMFPARKAVQKEKRRRKQREMETSEKNSRNNMQGTRQCGCNRGRGRNRGSGSGSRCDVQSQVQGRGGGREGWLLLQVAIVAACSLGQGVNNIFPTQLPSSCDVCNVQHRSANLKRHTAAAAVAAANKLKY